MTKNIVKWGERMTAFSLQRIVRPLGVFTALTLFVLFINSVRPALTPFIIGFIIAYILKPLVDVMECHRIPRSIAILLLYLAMALLVFLLFFFALPVLFRDLNTLVDLIPYYTEKVQEMLKGIQVGYNRVPMPEGIRRVSDDTIRQIETGSLDILQGFVQGLLGIFSQVFNLVLAPVLSFYILRDFDTLGKLVLNIVPVRYRVEAEQMGAEINQVIKKFIRGNLLVALIVAVMASIGMFLIGMDFPLLIGIIVGITNFIPYFGAFISTIPIVLLALIKSKWLALYVLGLMILIQQIEGNIISPKILGGCVGLHPLLIVFALLSSGYLLGFWGLLLAVPLAAVIKIMLKHIYLRLI